MAGACASTSRPASNPIRLMGSLKVDAGVTRVPQSPSCVSGLPVAASAITVHSTSARAAGMASAAPSAARIASRFKMFSVVSCSCRG